MKITFLKIKIQEKVIRPVTDKKVQKCSGLPNTRCIPTEYEQTTIRISVMLAVTERMTMWSTPDQ